MTLHNWPPQSVEAQLRGDFRLRNETFKPGDDGGFIDVVDVSPNRTALPAIAAKRDKEHLVHTEYETPADIVAPGRLPFRVKQQGLGEPIHDGHGKRGDEREDHLKGQNGIRVQQRLPGDDEMNHESDENSRDLTPKSTSRASFSLAGFQLTLIGRF